MSDYYISIKETLLEKKHFDAMGNTVWLYMWLLNKVTKIDKEGFGVVLGGKPIKHEDFKDNIAFTRRTYARYVIILEEAGYIKTIRTPYGLVFRVTKAKKFFANTEQNIKKRYANSGTSPYTKNGTSRTNFGTSRTKNGTSNKTIQLDNTNRQLGIYKNKTQMPDLSGDFYDKFDMRKLSQHA